MAEQSSWTDQIEAEDAQAAGVLPPSTVNQGAATSASPIGPVNQALLDGAAEARVLADLPDAEVAAPADGWARARDGRLARPSANPHHRLVVRAGQDRRDPAMASRSGSRDARHQEEAQERPRFQAFIPPASNAGDAAMTVPSPIISLRRGYVLRQAMSPEAKAMQDRRRKHYDPPRNFVVCKSEPHEPHAFLGLCGHLDSTMPAIVTAKLFDDEDLDQITQAICDTFSPRISASLRAKIEQFRLRPVEEGYPVVRALKNMLEHCVDPTAATHMKAQVKMRTSS